MEKERDVFQAKARRTGFCKGQGGATKRWVLSENLAVCQLKPLFEFLSGLEQNNNRRLLAWKQVGVGPSARENSRRFVGDPHRPVRSSIRVIGPGQPKKGECFAFIANTRFHKERARPTRLTSVGDSPKLRPSVVSILATISKSTTSASCLPCGGKSTQPDLGDPDAASRLYICAKPGAADARRSIHIRLRQDHGGMMVRGRAAKVARPPRKQRCWPPTCRNSMRSSNVINFGLVEVT